MNQRLFAEIRAAFQHADESSASVFIFLDDVHAAAANDVKFVARIALLDDGRTGWEVLSLLQIGDLYSAPPTANPSAPTPTTET